MSEGGIPWTEGTARTKIPAWGCTWLRNSKEARVVGVEPLRRGVTGQEVSKVSGQILWPWSHLGFYSE